MASSRLKIFCDFDGTVTQNDVWLNSLGKFIPDKEALASVSDEYASGKITIRETTERHLRLIRDFDVERFMHFINEEEIDPSFPAFSEFCKEAGHELYIVSSGFDIYIKPILEKYGIGNKWYGCRFITDPFSGLLSFEAVHSDEHCTDCTTCKRNLLLANTDDLHGEISVFIGDGASDYCVSRFADIVFAKKKLASYCWKNNITYFEYFSFDDVKKKLGKLAESGKLRQRQEASFRRREIYAGG